jgi:hypothetical protein
VWWDVDRTLELIRAHNHLPALTKKQMLTLELGDMLGDPRPCRTHQACQIVVAEEDAQERTSGLFDSKDRTQSKKRQYKALAKVETPSEEPIPLRQIVFVKFSQIRSGRVPGDDIELVPAHAADPAIAMSLASKMPPAH